MMVFTAVALLTLSLVKCEWQIQLKSVRIIINYYYHNTLVVYYNIVTCMKKKWKKSSLTYRNVHHSFVVGTFWYFNKIITSKKIKIVTFALCNDLQIIFRLFVYFTNVTLTLDDGHHITYWGSLPILIRYTIRIIIDYRNSL